MPTLRALRIRSLPAFLAAALAWLAATPTLAAESAYETINAFVAHFNEREVDGMLALAHADIEWLSVSGAEITVETRGKDALRKSMTSYFASCPTCRSTVEVYQQVGPYVSVLEHAEWQSDGKARGQSSLCVYELQDGLVRRVWYYPAAKSDEPAAAPAGS